MGQIAYSRVDPHSLVASPPTSPPDGGTRKHSANTANADGDTTYDRRLGRDSADTIRKPGVDPFHIVRSIQSMVKYGIVDYAIAPGHA